MSHVLFTSLPRTYRWRVIGALASGTLLLGGLIGYFGRELITASAPFGELSLQLVGDPLVAGSMFHEWAPAQLTLAQNLVVADYTFLLCYSTLLAFGCSWASTVWPKGVIARVGTTLMWGQWLAAIFDVLENTALLALLRVADPEVLPDAFAVSIARTSSLAKFGLIEMGLIYIAASAAYRALSWFRHSPSIAG